jgi:hypothetical protein
VQMAVQRRELVTIKQDLRKDKLALAVQAK